MASEDNQHLHINIYKDNQQKIDSSPNMSEAFLITTNEELNNKLRELLDELSTSNAEKDTLLEDNERMEVTVRNQRGLLHNFNGLKKYEEDRADLFEKMVKSQKEHLKEIQEFEKKLANHNSNIGIVFAFVTMFFITVGIIDVTSAVTFSVALVGSFYGTRNFTGFTKNDINNINSKYESQLKGIQVNVKEVENKINEIVSKSDFISDYIDVV
jgi:hypothetical protein